MHEYRSNIYLSELVHFPFLSTMSSGPLHPYFPRTLVLPNYVPPTYRLSFTLGVILAVVGIMTIATYLLAHLKGLPVVDGMLFTWFMLSGFIHCSLQAYFVLFHRTLPSDNFIIAQMWKEYGKCDSRYLSSNRLLWCSEVIMLVFVGPMCFYTSYLIYVDSLLSHVYILICSLSHGLVTSIYMLTSILDGCQECTPNRYYFWLYFITFNSPWIILPLLLTVRSIVFFHQSIPAEYHPY